MGRDIDPLDELMARMPRVFDSSEGTVTRLTPAEVAAGVAVLAAALERTQPVPAPGHKHEPEER